MSLQEEKIGLEKQIDLLAEGKSVAEAEIKKLRQG